MNHTRNSTLMLPDMRSVQAFNCYFQVVEDGYEFFAKRQLVTLFSAPNYCGEFDNAGAMMSVDDTLMCSFQVSENLLHSCCGPVLFQCSKDCVPCGLGVQGKVLRPFDYLMETT